MSAWISAIELAAARPLVGEAVGSLPGWVMQFGALGLCAYMVWRLYAQHQAAMQMAEDRHRKAMEVLAAKDEVLERRTEELSALARQNIAAYHRLADVLGDRPCVASDRRLHGGGS